MRTSYGDGQQMLDVHQFTTVDVDQFYGIEIEEFPAQIAQVAMWLTDHQMNRALSDEFGKYFDRLPLKSTPHIRHGNALQIDWQEVLPSERCSYVLGNPPFVGYSYQGAEQKADMVTVMQGVEGAGVLDFVAAWYVKAARYITKEKWGQIPIQEDSASGARAVITKLGSDPTFPHLPETATRVAFVSTNSISQGEQVAPLWSWMFAQGMQIHFAHRTFRWSNEASGKAAVHCVIIGFGLEDISNKTIYEYENVNSQPHPVAAKNINPYLVDATNVFLQKRGAPISPVPAIQRGSDATDDGNLLLSNEERITLLTTSPDSEKWIKRFVMGNEFINNIPRWCLWLDGINPAALRAMPAVNKRIAAVKTFRQSSKRAKTQQMADYPSSFSEPRQPTTRYLAIPKVSSERRDFIPIAFLEADVIAGDKIFTMPGAGLYHFGVLTSSMHMAWVRNTCGRLKSDYSYSNTIVYNNFPWPTIVEKPAKDQQNKAQAAIESAAQAVLDARVQFPGSSLADLYDPLTMPPALVKAHQKLDAAVDAAYAQDAVHPGKKNLRHRRRARSLPV